MLFDKTNKGLIYIDDIFNIIPKSFLNILVREIKW